MVLHEVIGGRDRRFEGWRFILGHTGISHPDSLEGFLKRVFSLSLPHGPKKEEQHSQGGLKNELFDSAGRHETRLRSSLLSKARDPSASFPLRRSFKNLLRLVCFGQPFVHMRCFCLSYPCSRCYEPYEPMSLPSHVFLIQGTIISPRLPTLRSSAAPFRRTAFFLAQEGLAAKLAAQLESCHLEREEPGDTRRRGGLFAMAVNGQEEFVVG